MRLIGRPPGEKTVKGVQVPCVRTEDAHCGWAWGTQYAGSEQANGIDEMGYLSAEGLRPDEELPRLRDASMTRPGHAPQACSRRSSPGG